MPGIGIIGGRFGGTATPPPSVSITNSLKFDGVNDISFATPPIENNEDFSVSFWFKVASLSGRSSLLSFYNLFISSRDSLTIYYESNAIYALSNSTGWNANRNLPWTGDLNWHNFVFTNENSSNAKEMFVDGVSIGNINSDVLIGAFDSFVLGHARKAYGNVNMADVALHDTILTQAEITAMQTVNVVSGHEVMRYPFNEAVGTTTGELTDSINGQKMKLRGMTTGYGIVLDAPT